MTDLKELKRMNLIRIMKEEHVSQAELARRLGTTPQNVNLFLKRDTSFGDAVAMKLAEVLNRDPIEFYYLDFNWGSVSASNETTNILLDVKSIMESGDDFIRRSFKNRIKEYKELISRDKKREAENKFQKQRK